MGDDATAPDAWQELRAIADALQDDLIVLPEELEADEADVEPSPGPRSELDPWDELRAIAGAAGPERPAPRQQR